LLPAKCVSRSREIILIWKPKISMKLCVMHLFDS